MQKTFNSVISLLLVILAISCNSQSKEKETTKTCCSQAAENSKTVNTCCSQTEEGLVKVYYFHNTRRCATCEAVENVTKEALNQSFASEMQDGSLSFISVNLEKDKDLANRLGVSGQTLLLVSQDQKINLTTDAFLLARSKPDQLKKKLKNSIQSLL